MLTLTLKQYQLFFLEYNYYIKLRRTPTKAQFLLKQKNSKN